MNTRKILSILCAMVMLVSTTSAFAMTTADKESNYNAAVLQLETYLETSGDNSAELAKIQSAFNELGGYEQSKFLGYYVSVLMKIADEAYDDFTLMLNLDMMDKNEGFKAYLKDALNGSSIGSVEDLIEYTNAREAEYKQDDEQAIAHYENCLGFFDASERYRSLIEGDYQKKYNHALDLLAKGDAAGAYYVFADIRRFSDSEAYMTSIVNLLGYTPVSSDDNLQPVQGLRVTESGSDHITIIWNKSNHAESYEVYYKNQDETEWQFALTTTESTATIPGLTSGNRYDIQVLSVIGRIKSSGALLSLQTERVPLFTATDMDFEYQVYSDGTAEIIHSVKSQDSLVIPSELGGYPVTSIGDLAFESDSDTSGDMYSFRSVTIPDSIIHLGKNPFAHCHSLNTIEVSPNHPTLTVVDNVLFNKDMTSLICYPCWKSGSDFTIPFGVLHIADYAFYGNLCLESITIPNSVTTLGDHVFSHCWELKSISIPDSVIAIGKAPFSGCRNLSDISVSKDQPALTIRDNVVFNKDMTSLIYYQPSGEEKTYIIPNGVKTIEDEAFYGCDNLQTITIPNSVTSIGDRAFEDCYPLTSIHIPDSVTHIGNGLFSYCYSLSIISVSSNHPALTVVDGVLFDKDMTTLIYYPSEKTNEIYDIPYGVKYIGYHAFGSNRYLSTINIPNSVTSIGEGAFCGCGHLTSITIPYGVSSIEKETFAYSSITAINIPDSVTSIGDEAFENCDRLMSIDIPSSVENIGIAAFRECDGLTNFIIPNSITSIKKSTFRCCHNLKNITIPNSVTRIGDDAFNCCGELVSIAIPNSVVSIGDGAFRSCHNLKDLFLPDSVTTIGKVVFPRYGSLSEITVSQDNPAFMVQDNVLFDKELKTLVYYPIAKPGGVYDIPYGVNYIGYGAFDGNKNLTTVNIPSSVTSIGEYAFDYCKNLTSITIPNGVTSIGKSAFRGCENLTSVVIPNSVTTLEEDMFAWCEKLSSITIPNSVTSIGKSAFSGCDNLTSVVIPNSVTSVGEEAFAYCDNLEAVSLPGSLSQIGNNAFERCESLIHISVSQDNPAFTVLDNVLFDKEMKTLVYYPANKSGEVYDLPHGVKYIGYGAFINNNNLTSINIPNSVTSIGENAFPRNITVIVEKGSYTETYCKENNIKYKYQ